MTPEPKWGLLACGHSGQTAVDVDQSCGPEQLFAIELSTPTWSLCFRISDPAIVQTLASFLQPGPEESLLIGTFGDFPVEVRRDREYGDRFFMTIGASCARAQLTIAGERQISELIAALTQAVEDLTDRP